MITSPSVHKCFVFVFIASLAATLSAETPLIQVSAV